MLILTRKGLYCPAGDFYIDPSGAVDRAVVTHAHSDHARRGSRLYYCVSSGESLLRARLGKKIATETHNYGEVFELGPVKVSFHPAGHILGSSQVRLEYGGEVWVSSGDYKRDYDPTCEAFEVVPCDVFVTEATFGTPAYQWPKDADLGKEIYDWWKENAKREINSVVTAYSLGKTQRILGVLKDYEIPEIYCHQSAAPLNECYLAHGVGLAKHRCLSELKNSARPQGALFIAPSAFLKSDQAEVLGKYETAFASGWMAKGGFGYENIQKGFVMSDHADWNDLLLTIQQTKAKRVYVQHRGHGALVKYLRGLGLQAFPDSDLEAEIPNQLSFF